MLDSPDTDNRVPEVEPSPEDGFQALSENGGISTGSPITLILCIIGVTVCLIVIAYGLYRICTLRSHQSEPIALTPTLSFSKPNVAANTVRTIPSAINTSTSIPEWDRSTKSDSIRITKLSADPIIDSTKMTKSQFDGFGIVEILRLERFENAKYGDEFLLGGRQIEKFLLDHPDYVQVARFLTDEFPHLLCSLVETKMHIGESLYALSRIGSTESESSESKGDETGHPQKARRLTLSDLEFQHTEALRFESYHLELMKLITEDQQERDSHTSMLRDLYQDHLEKYTKKHMQLNGKVMGLVKEKAEDGK